jgi:NADH:ubiquinone oxidoreductase subunit 5 (subunit L)/multisubunit Na+/H+ antiporter MnhA subunit
MDLARILPLLLGTAWLLPLGSFTLIVLLGPRMGKGGRCAAYVATGAILLSLVLSTGALVGWLAAHPLQAASHGAVGGHGDADKETRRGGAGETLASNASSVSSGLPVSLSPPLPVSPTPSLPHSPSPLSAEPITGEWYPLAVFDSLRIPIGYYIDGLTIAMFCMVTLVASCIHIYSYGYMHEELHEVTDPLVTLSGGRPFRRRGRFHRFYQYLSLFCFSMLGLVIAGNVAMVFACWELVGICSYLLIGFYIERKSASTAANKAFIVNRVGDFGMIIGLMAVWTGFGTFSFGNQKDASGEVVQAGIFHQVRPTAEQHVPLVPDGMVKLAARREVEQIVLKAPNAAEADRQIAAQVPLWRERGYGYWLLVIAGLGIFCGCVGKSAQFPLHVWLPDAMEGPTPVSALIHAATMVAAGVYLVGRFYPVFTPEVLLTIAYIGCITLFLAATIALVVTDIKRVLAYSTVSQLGYMMLALGAGGWLAGIFHLFTHAFFKSLLFLCSGSVIHACHTNEMPYMGGLRKKMPWTAYTMLVGCLAISGAGVPTLVGLSGYYSKDYIIAQLLSFQSSNPAHAWLFYVAAGGAGMTAFYMFRLWFMTFAGTPRDKHVYEHAHESPRAMTIPLVILAVCSVVAGWNLLATNIGLEPLLEQARPVGTAEGGTAGLLLPSVTQPAEHLIHTPVVHVKASYIAFVMALLGFLLATAFYGLRRLDPADVRRQFAPLYNFLIHKWWFDELYQWAFVRPVLRLSDWVAAIDQQGIDWLADHAARGVVVLSRLDDWIDRTFVDTTVNLLARWTYALGLKLRTLQTGSIRQYVMLMALGVVALFVLMSIYWNCAVAGV